MRRLRERGKSCRGRGAARETEHRAYVDLGRGEAVPPPSRVDAVSTDYRLVSDANANGQGRGERVRGTERRK